MNVRDADSGSSLKPAIACWNATKGLRMLIDRFSFKPSRDRSKGSSAGLKFAALATGYQLSSINWLGMGIPL